MLVDDENLAPHRVLPVGIWSRPSGREGYDCCVGREGSADGRSCLVDEVGWEMGIRYSQYICA